MLSQSVPLTEITRFPLVSTMSIDDHELCDDSSLRATKTVAWQRLKQALCFSLGYSITLWKSFSHICWIRAILLEIFLKILKQVYHMKPWQQPVICTIFEFKLQASWSLVHLEIYQLRSELLKISYKIVWNILLSF